MDKPIIKGKLYFKKREYSAVKEKYLVSVLLLVYLPLIKAPR